MVLVASLVGLSPGSSAGAARGGQIAIVDSDSTSGLSAIVLIPSDRLATREDSKVLVSGPGTISNLQWAWDGKTLAYDETAHNQTDIYVIDVPSRRRTLLATHVGALNVGALSPDGKSVAYWAQARSGSIALYVVDTDGRSRRRLVAGADPTWSSDGRRLALLTVAGRIATIGADGSGLRTAGPIRDPAGHAVTGIDSLAWQPDGQSLLVSSFSLELVETIAVTGTVKHVFSTRAGLRAAWSPDGTRVAFSELSGQNRDSVVVANQDGSSRRTVDSVSQGVEPVDLAWSPDGTSIVTADGERVRVVAADGTGGKVIAYPGQEHYLSDAAWQPLS